MKYMKRISILALALLMFSCSDDDKGNKGDVKIGFAAVEQAFSYSDFLYIPIKAEGVVDGDINIQVDVKEYTGNFAVKENVDYIITSKKLVLKKGMSEVNLEVRIINKPDEARFALAIQHVGHAELKESTKETLISIAKTDFDRLTGVYNFAGTSVKDNTPLSFPLTVGVETSNEEFNVAGWNGEDDAFIMEYDADNEIVSIPSANVMGAYNFSGIGAHYIALCTFSKVSGQITFEPVKGTWDELFSEITLDNTYGLVIALFTYPDGQLTNYIYGPKMIDFTMIRDNSSAEQSVNAQVAGLKFDEKLIRECPEMFNDLKNSGFKLQVSKKIECR